MANKQLNCIFSATDVFIQYSNEKGKVNTIIYFIVHLITKQTWWKYAFLHNKFYFQFVKIRFSF